MDLFLRIDINIIAFILLISVLAIANKRLSRGNNLNVLFLRVSILVLIELALESFLYAIDPNRDELSLFLINIIHMIIFIIGPIATFLWCVFVNMWVISNDFIVTKKLIKLLIPCVFNFLVILINPITGLVFTVDSFVGYSRGPLFLVPIVIAYSYLVYSFYLVVRNKNKILKEVYYSMILFGIFPAVGGGIQIILNNFLLLMWGSAAFSLIIAFIFIQQRMTQFDSLTGAWTKGSFENYIEQIMIKEKSNVRFGVIFVDLDKLKHINDTFGHLEGDFALKNLVNLMKHSLRKSDIIARFGGDEFVILLEKISKKDIEEVVKRMESRFFRYNKTSRKQYSLEYSIGYEVYDPSKYSISQFIDHVDRLMYQNKQKKKNKNFRRI